MARGTRTVYPGKRNKGLSSTFQPPEEGRTVQRPKRWDKHGEKDEDNSPENVNNENSWIHTFPKSISAMWNANSLVLGSNSGRRVNFLYDIYLNWKWNTK